MTPKQIDIQKEFYLHLLSLDEKEDPDDYPKKALRLLAALAQADQGFIELRNQEGKIHFSSFSFTDQEVENVQAIIPKEVIKEAIEKNR